MRRGRTEKMAGLEPPKGQPGERRKLDADWEKRI